MAQKRQLTRFRKLLTIWQKKLGLMEWMIQADVSATVPKGVGAQITLKSDYLLGFVQVPETTLNHREEDWEWYVVHELLHLLQAPIEKVHSELLETLSPREAEVYSACWETAIEHMTQRLTAIITGKQQRVWSDD